MTEPAPDAPASQLNDTLDAIDAANAADPNQLGTVPLAFAQGRLASLWLERLAADSNATVEAPLVVAARAHHLGRWEIERGSYREGRAGYLQWRRDNKAHQANRTADILESHGWDRAMISRTGDLLLRKGLGSDAQTQMLEDAACLVFLETQFDDMVRRLGHEHMIQVVARTLKKMSPQAHGLAAGIELSAGAAAVLDAAIDQVGQGG